jgi:hypothetical protein
LLVGAHRRLSSRICFGFAGDGSVLDRTATAASAAASAESRAEAEIREDMGLLSVASMFQRDLSKSSLEVRWRLLSAFFIGCVWEPMDVFRIYAAAFE